MQKKATILGGTAMAAGLAVTALFSAAHAQSAPSSPQEVAETAALNQGIVDANDAALAEYAAKEAAYQEELARAQERQRQYEADMQAHQAEVQAHEAEVTAYEQEMQAYRDAYGE